MEPLASKIRPQNLSQFIGQEHLVGPNKPISIAIEQKHVFSFVLWGPPGVGKTTLARIYAKSLNADYHELSAVSAGKDDIRQIVDSGIKGTGELLGPKILFLDEIHRFNKAQQDFLLPYVESGRLILIGATTENPGFEIIPALLSRLRVFVLEEFSIDDMKKIIKRTGYKIDKKTTDFIIRISGGDARQTISIIENTISLYKEITLENLKNTIQSKFLRYDKKGDEHYNTISAFIKSMRASNSDAALYYLARMLDAGEDPKFIARRMVIFASEDIGIALPTALVVANDVFRAVETLGMPECAINLSHGVVYLSQAPKDRSTYNAYNKALDDVRRYGNLPIPLIIRNPTTKLTKELGYGENYEIYTKENLMPEKLKNKKYLENKHKNTKTGE
jgi:putative ATPase